MHRRVPAAAALVLLFASNAARAHELAGTPTGWQDWLGRFHPALVHFPVALILAALVAEIVCVATRAGRYGDIARFLVNVAAWISIPLRRVSVPTRGCAPRPKPVTPRPSAGHGS